MIQSYFGHNMYCRPVFSRLLFSASKKVRHFMDAPVTLNSVNDANNHFTHTTIFHCLKGNRFAFGLHFVPVNHMTRFSLWLHCSCLTHCVMMWLYHVIYSVWFMCYESLLLEWKLFKICTEKLFVFVCWFKDYLPLS